MNANTIKETASNCSISGTYTIHVGAYDWGPAVDSVILKLDRTITLIDSNAIEVFQTSQKTAMTPPGFPIVTITAPRTVVDAYLCDESGVRNDTPGNLICLELEVTPRCWITSGIFDGDNEEFLV